LQSSTDAPRVRCSRLVTADFTDAHAHARLPGSLERLWTPFPRTAVRFPFVLDGEHRATPTSSASPTSKLSSLRESVRDRFEFPRADRPLLFWASSSLESSPTTPGVLEPALAETKTPPSSADSSARPNGANPPRSGELTRSTRLETARRRAPIPLEIGPNRLSAAPLLPWPRSSGRTPHLRPSECRRNMVSGISSAEAPALLRFLTSSAVSQLRALVGPGSWIHRAFGFRLRSPSCPSDLGRPSRRAP